VTGANRENLDADAPKNCQTHHKTADSNKRVHIQKKCVIVRSISLWLADQIGDWHIDPDAVIQYCGTWCLGLGKRSPADGRQRLNSQCSDSLALDADWLAKQKWSLIMWCHWPRMAHASS